MKNQCEENKLILIRDLNQGYSFPPSPLWHFDPNPGHGLPLRGFVITLIRHTTVGVTPLDE